MRYQDFKDVINEAEMNPKTFAAAIKEGGDLGVLVGFEFEVCIPKDNVVAWEQQGAAEQAVDEPIDFGGMTVKGFMQKFTRFAAANQLDNYLVSVEPIPGAESDEHKIYATYAKLSRVPEFKTALNSALEASVAYLQRYQRNQALPPTVEAWYPEVIEQLQQKGIDISTDEKITAKLDHNWLSFINQVREQTTKILREYGSKQSELYNNSYGTEEYHQVDDTYSFWTQFRNDFNNSLRNFQLLETTTSRDSFATWTKQTFSATKMSALVPAKWKIPEGKQKAIRNILNGRSPDYDPSRYGRSSGYGRGAEFVQSKIAPVFGKTNIFSSYHQASKNLTDWYIEPDGSLHPKSGDFACEVVTPPMPAPEAMENLKKFYSIAKENGFYTGKEFSTGLHINVSIPRELDVLKLALFLGDEYVLKAFGRESNTYARSIVKNLKSDTPSVSWNTVSDKMGKLKNMAASISRDHFCSVNNTGKYVSFRHAGGDYLKQPDEIINVVGRFVRSMTIASDPESYRNEYLAKATKFMQAPEKTATDMRDVLKNIREKGVSVIQHQTYFWDDVPDQAGLDSVAQRMYGVGSDDIKVVDVVRGSEESKQKLLDAGGWSSGTKQKLEAAEPDKFVAFSVIPISVRGATALGKPQELNKAVGAYLNGSRIGATVKSSQEKLNKDDPAYQQVVRQVIKQASDQLIKDRAARAGQPAASDRPPERALYRATDIRSGDILVAASMRDWNTIWTLATGTADRRNIPQDAIRITDQETNRVYFIDGTPVTAETQAQRSQQSQAAPTGGPSASDISIYQIVDNRNGEAIFLRTMSWAEAEQQANNIIGSYGIPREEIRIIDLNTSRRYFITGTPAEAEATASTPAQQPSQATEPATPRPITWQIVDFDDDAEPIERVTGSVEDAAQVAMDYVRQGINAAVYNPTNGEHYSPRDLSRMDESREYGDPAPIYYFAYGMLTDPGQMEGAEFVGAATLPNFGFEFRNYANVYPTRGAVLGVLWKVSREWLSHLDRVEGYPTLYDRKTVPVYCKGQRYEANIYTMTPDTREQLEGKQPRRTYVMRLVKGYNNAELPLQQISKALGQ